jgi:hypothetical protein
MPRTQRSGTFAGALVYSEQMRLALALGLVAALLPPAAPPVVGCARRAEPSPPAPTADRWIVAGPVAWPRVDHDPISRRRGGVSVKRGISVAAGAAVTVRVITRGAALVYRPATRLAERPDDADRVLRFRPCAPETPGFSSGGTVGPRTGFPGGLIAERRMCVRVRVSRGGRHWRARIPVGRRCR